MNILVQVKPTNLLSEKEKFFADRSYNPQFTYTEPLAPEKLTQWGTPKQELYEYALEMLKDYSLPQLPDEENRVTQEIVKKKVAEFNARHALPNQLEVYFQNNLVSRCKVTASAIYFQLPLLYSHEQLEDLLRHELDTHILRYHNHALQTWKAHISPETLIRRTEEGLANIHTHLFRKEKLLYKSFFSYVAAYTAQRHSFAEVFHTLVDLGRSEQTSWNTAVKVKRGMTDTSKPGVFSREICYLEGAIMMCQWLLDANHECTQLYWGRLAVEELPNFSNTAGSALKLPTFMQESETYLAHVAEIQKVNRFAEIQGIL